MLSDGDCYLVSILHNSDLRDWPEYTLKQVWCEVSGFFKGRVAGVLAKTRLAYASSIVFYDRFYSPHIYRNILCTLGCL